MKKCWLILLALTVVTAMFAYEVVAWQEDFEGDISGWTHYDGAESPNMWHIYDYGGAQGNVWWMGDPDLAQGNNIGGYHNAQYLVLDTPARTLTASNATLTFKMRYKVEDPGGTSEYNIWDSMNIRVSTDNGATWTVIAGTPPYSGTSSYAFGGQHGEGPGIPAWGGSLPNWTTATFNLSAYVGQSVKVRFAFASDPAYSTANDRSLFGWMVDDISFGGYTNNGVDDGQMTFASMVPMGGDLWHLSTDPAAPSPTHVMKCQNDQGTYNPNMYNYLVSPSIVLPSSGDIRVDFMLKGDFIDYGTFPDVDFHGWEISPDDGQSWFYMSNPYGIDGVNNYVYSDAPDTWMSMVESYSLNGYISEYAGHTIRLRWFFKSNATVAGGGYMIDDVKVYHDVYIESPSNLTATVDGSNVILNWELGDFGGGEEGWLGYCTDTLNTGIGTGNAADFDVAIKWDPSGEYGINPYVGMQITKIKFIPASVNPQSPTVCDYSVRIWTGTTGNEMVHDQVVPSVTPNEWNEIVLTTPWTIPPRVAVWAGYRNNYTSGHPAGCDDGPAVDGYGNMIKFSGGSWGTLLSPNPMLNYNWNIEVYVQDAGGREYKLTRNQESNREATSFKIYRDDALIDHIEDDTMTYIDTNVAAGLHSYYVTTACGQYESSPSNIATVFIQPDDSTISNYPWTEDFDSVSIGRMPDYWTIISSHSGAEERGWKAASDVGASSEPNAAVVYSHDEYAKNEWMISVPFSMQAEQTYHISFKVKGENEALALHWGGLPTVASMMNNVVLHDNNQINYANWTEERVMFIPPATGVYYFGWHAYTPVGGDYLAVDDISIVLAPDIDLAATGLCAQAYGDVGTAIDLSVTIKNWGGNVQTYYDLYIKEQGTDTVLAQEQIMDLINPNQSKTYTLSWTPTAAGNISIYAEVNVAGDADASNNCTEAKQVLIYPANMKLLYVGYPSSTLVGPVCPFNLFHEDFVAETVYLANEIQATGGELQAIAYYNNFPSAQSFPVQIWMQNTDAMSVRDGWLPWDGYQLVFDGIIECPEGFNEIIIPITHFNYTGSNLAIRTSRTWDGNTVTGHNWLLTRDGNYSRRTRMYQANISDLDHTNPTAGAAIDMVPNINFYLATDGLVDAVATPVVEISISGMGALLEWELIPYAHSYKVYASGNAYNFSSEPTVVYGNSITVSTFANKGFYKVTSNTYRDFGGRDVVVDRLARREFIVIDDELWAEPNVIEKAKSGFRKRP